MSEIEREIGKMSDMVCPSCGIQFEQHIGLVGMCKQLQVAIKQRDELKDELEETEISNEVFRRGCGIKDDLIEVLRLKLRKAIKDRDEKCSNCYMEQQIKDVTKERDEARAALKEIMEIHDYDESYTGEMVNRWRKAAGNEA